MKKKTFIVFLCIITVISIFLRLYKIDAPIADWHSWRQSDTASVARNFTRWGIDLLHPRYDDLSNIQSGKDNPQGYRMVEFPLYQGMAAGLFTIHSGFSIELWLRIITILASTGTALLIAILLFHFGQPLGGVLAMLTYAILPYSVFYGRTILPDPLMVFFAIASITCMVFFHGSKGVGKKVCLFLGSAVLGSLAMLVKPYAGFLLLPIIPLIFDENMHVVKKIGIGVLFAIIVLGPFIGWRMWILQYPEGIPVSEWLFNGNGIRFKGAWFEWLFAKRLGELILGYWGMIPFGLGLALLSVKKKGGWVILTLGIGTLLYLTIVASGNVQHDYYQIFCLPIIAILTGIGLGALVNPKGYGLSGIHPFVGRGVAFVSLGFACMFSWYIIRTYYWINRPEIVEVGKLANQLLPEDAKVIASYNGDTTFLYQTGRQGWPLGFDIPQKLVMGATHYVTVSPTDNDLETRDLARDYTVLVRTDKYAIIDLTKPKN